MKGEKPLCAGCGVEMDIIEGEERSYCDYCAKLMGNKVSEPKERMARKWFGMQELSLVILGGKMRRFLGIPRKYRVPEGLLFTICLWLDQNDHSGHLRAWKLIKERCPETRDGHWNFIQDGSSAYVVEVL